MPLDLEQLLQEIFDRATLQRFLYRFPEHMDLCASLPGDAASWKLTAQRAAEDLRRRGYPLQPDFWQAMLDAVPGRGDHIRAVMTRGWPNVPMLSAHDRREARAPGRSRLIPFVSVLASALVLVISISYVAAREPSPDWEVLAMTTRRVPSLVVHEDPSVLTLEMLRRNSEAEVAFEAQDVRAARFEIMAAEEAARELERETPDETNTHNLASVLERRALVELRLGGVHNVRGLLNEAITLRERALLQHVENPRHGAQLAATLRRTAVVLARIGDIQGASRSLSDATSVLDRLPQTETVRDSLHTIESMRGALKELATRPPSDDHSWDTLFMSVDHDECLEQLDRGEAAFDLSDHLAAQDEFEQLLSRCTEPTVNDLDAGLEALGLSWLAAASCNIALVTEDSEVRVALLESANAFFEDFEAVYHDSPARAPRIAQSQERARTAALNCRLRAGQLQGSMDLAGHGRAATH